MRGGSARQYTHTQIRNQTAREYRRVEKSRKPWREAEFGLGRRWVVICGEAVCAAAVRSVVSVQKRCASLELSAASEVLRRDEAIREGSNGTEPSELAVQRPSRTSSEATPRRTITSLDGSRGRSRWGTAEGNGRIERSPRHKSEEKRSRCPRIRHGSKQYVGHIITTRGVHPDPKKIDLIRRFPAPKNVKQSTTGTRRRAPSTGDRTPKARGNGPSRDRSADKGTPPLEGDRRGIPQRTAQEPDIKKGIHKSVDRSLIWHTTYQTTRRGDGKAKVPHVQNPTRRRFAITRRKKVKI
ncbi:unnamed protein product [Trichogramma brassicae]|uniref:Uncharacterized protein n=1 Tax=Trichogramma brassicae TaxID=86971 RepID=A0A6H5IY41_9HYME|nr:unnamed protein product [Trichogramma brassicae]